MPIVVGVMQRDLTAKFNAYACKKRDFSGLPIPFSRRD